MEEGNAVQENLRRRLPSVEKKISDIGQEDVRVKIMGTVIDKQKDRVVVDDGTGKVSVVFDRPIDTNLNQTARIFGRVIPVENGFEIQGEIFQDMSKLDMELFKKIESIKI